jgi:hypothetical protein
MGDTAKGSYTARDLVQFGDRWPSDTSNGNSNTGGSVRGELHYGCSTDWNEMLHHPLTRLEHAAEYLLDELRDPADSDSAFWWYCGTVDAVSALWAAAGRVRMVPLAEQWHDRVTHGLYTAQYEWAPGQWR